MIHRKNWILTKIEFASSFGKSKNFDFLKKIFSSAFGRWTIENWRKMIERFYIAKTIVHSWYVERKWRKLFVRTNSFRSTVLNTVDDLHLTMFSMSRRLKKKFFITVVSNVLLTCRSMGKICICDRKMIRLHCFFIVFSYISTCFAYGQTGSGKTHTMIGPGGANIVRDFAFFDVRKKKRRFPLWSRFFLVQYGREFPNKKLRFGSTSN